MSKILEHSKAELLSKFSITPPESLPESFQALLSSLPMVFSKESLNPNSSMFSFNGDDAVLPTIKPMGKTWGKPSFFNAQSSQIHQINPLNSQVPYTKTHSSDNYNSFNYKARNLIRTPFSSSGFSTDLGERVWFYIDEQNEIQGPFTTFEMDNWFEKGYLFDELKICHAANNKFFPLYELFVERTTKSSSNIEAEENLAETGQKNPANTHFVNINNPNSINNCQQNVISMPIHPNFNPLLAQPNTNMQKSPNFSENIEKKSVVNDNLATKTQGEGKTEQKNVMKTNENSLNSSNYGNNLKKEAPETSQNLEKTQSRTSEPEIKPMEELKKKSASTSAKAGYVRVFEPKKPAATEEPAKKLEEPAEPLDFSSDIRLAKDLKQHKSNAIKDKYYVVYMPKSKENKVQDTEEELKPQKKNKKRNNNKLHSSNTPEKRNPEENDKFNTQFYPKETKESKPGNKNNKPLVYKEYTVKK